MQAKTDMSFTRANGQDRKKIHFPSRIYQQALAKLRDRHLEEFQEIRLRLFKENGMKMLSPTRQRRKSD